MKRSFLLTALAVATLSVNVLAIQAEAGTTGLKPSANQGVTQSSGNASTTNTDVQNVQYDTGKYQYPAQQLKAEGKNFDRYDWHLYQRFDNGQLMYYQWADDTDHIIEEGRYGTNGKGKKYGIEGILSLEPLYVNPEAWEREVDVDECPEVDGYRVVYPDKLISFESKRTDQFGLRIQIQTPVFLNPALTYSQELTIVLPTDFAAGVGNWRIFDLRQKYEFQGNARRAGKVKHVYYTVFYSLKRNVTNVRLYRENQNEVLYISTDQLNQISLMMRVTANKPFGQLHKDITNYGFIEWHDGIKLLY